MTLAVHTCVLFNCFLQAQYLPRTFMDSVIIPVVKSKSGDLADINNYRAIAISTSMSKLFECAIANKVSSYSSDCDKYQFGFKSGHSRSLCTSILKKTVDYYTCHGSYVFTCFIDLKLSIVLITGNCLINCLMMVSMSVSLLYELIGILINVCVYAGKTRSQTVSV